MGTLTLSPRHTSVHDKELVSLALSLSFFTTPPHAPPNGTRVHSRLYRPPVNTQKESMHFSTTTTLVLSALSLASFASAGHSKHEHRAVIARRSAAANPHAAVARRSASANYDWSSMSPADARSGEEWDAAVAHFDSNDSGSTASSSSSSSDDDWECDDDTSADDSGSDSSYQAASSSSSAEASTTTDSGNADSGNFIKKESSSFSSPTSESTSASGNNNNGGGNGSGTSSSSTSSSAAAAQTSSGFSNSGTYSGSATFFYQNGNPGHCGNYNDDSTPLVALQTSMYGDGSHCGDKVCITRTSDGKTVEAIVQDSCPSCVSTESLDLSWGAFSQIATEAEGMVDITWSFC